MALLKLCLAHLPTALLILSAANRVLAGIGPTADILVHNANVSPDGFTRKATVFNGRIDTTFISGTKVRPLIIRLVDMLSPFFRVIQCG